MSSLGSLKDLREPSTLTTSEGNCVRHSYKYALFGFSMSGNGMIFHNFTGVQDCYGRHSVPLPSCCFGRALD